MKETEVDIERVCDIIDKLTLDSLTLMEEYIVAKLDIEKKMCEGESHLAKSRYIMGQNTVSKLQLPTEESELEATTVVDVQNDADSVSDGQLRDLVIDQRKHNPVKWFGVLVPRNLHYAQSKFKEALMSVVKAANVQAKLDETCTTIEQLKTLKQRQDTIKQ